MLRNPVDEDRLRLFPKAQRKEYIRQADMRDGGCNDAELVAEMRREGTLKVLDPKTYGVPDARLSTKPPKEMRRGYGFRIGDPIIVTIHWPWAREEIRCRVAAVIEGGFIRADRNKSELYPVKQVRRA